jgi:hypothetical protein
MKVKLEGNQLYVGIRHVGEIVELKNGEKCYLSYRNDEHVFHKYGEGIGLSECLIDFLISNKIEHIVINYKNLRGYLSNVSSFLVHGVEYNDMGDLQLILPFKYWKDELMVEQIKVNQTIL